MLDTRLRRQKPPPANSRQRPNVGVYGGCGFLHRDLGLSKGASHFRKVAAELIQRYPEVVDPLRDGRLCITSVVELARVITPENRSDVLPRFFHASKQEAKAVAAEILPAVVVPRREMVTTVPVPAARAMVLPGATMGAPVSEPAAVRQDGAEVLPVEPQPSLPPRPAPPTSVQPLTAEARRLHMTVSKRFLEKLEVARDALSHSHPGADAEAILEAGLDLLIERAAKKKGLSTRPCTGHVRGRRPSGPLRRSRPCRSTKNRRLQDARPPPSPAPATSLPTSAARSGSETRDAASGDWRPARSAAPTTGFSSTTFTHSRWAASPLSVTLDWPVLPITCSRRGESSATR